ncbi:hypothetical protein I5V12_16780 [Stenotrophomonas maltophilia]|uniref:hypothetical protein n=1 Tax=unclassified Stenotrophomonas TaxID=196198 RepID=UPI0018D4B0D0|nr:MULTISPECIES: hypothetical protein [unclassified Stenotrophomonas]MBH1739233.1 hypothetical protein [Stenotrophomonas maltophilia]WNB79329.1 hypothetical protein Q9R16_16155 [Stenotrophomonas sp. 9]
MNTSTSARGWPWGLVALGLSVLAWASLLLGVMAFAASFGSPGDGNHGIQALQYWIVAALVTLGVSFVGSLVAIVLAWRRRRRPVAAAVAGALLVMLVSLALIVIGSSWG